jgi:hypothetical protein
LFDSLKSIHTANVLLETVILPAFDEVPALTDEERESLLFCYRAALPETEKLGGNAGELCRMHRDTLRGLLERLG